MDRTFKGLWARLDRKEYKYAKSSMKASSLSFWLICYRATKECLVLPALSGSKVSR